MANTAVRAQLQSLGIDDALIRDIMNSVQPDPITGKIGVDALMKYIMESKNPHLSKVLQNGARLVEQQRRETLIDWSKIDFLRIPVEEDVTWWLRSTVLADGGTARKPARVMLECMTYGNKIDSPRLVDKYKSLPNAEEVLHFIRRCMAKPLPGLEPAIPSILIIQRDFHHYTSDLASFLDTLPSPFSWAIEAEFASSSSASFSSASSSSASSPSSSRTGKFSLFSWEIPLSVAQTSKSQGNELYAQSDHKGAILAYTDAIERLMNAFRSDPSKEKNREAEKLLAVCLANRAAAYLAMELEERDEGERDSQLHEAWKDGQVAIRVDPSYAKGYMRVSTAHQRLGHLRKAQETLANGLRRPELQNEAGLVDRLLLLQTDGRGLADDEEEFLAWRELTLVEDEMMKGIGGLYKNRLDQHLAKLR